jgi:hypothetical protein
MKRRSHFSNVTLKSKFQTDDRESYTDNIFAYLRFNTGRIDKWLKHKQQIKKIHILRGILLLIQLLLKKIWACSSVVG